MFSSQVRSYKKTSMLTIIASSFIREQLKTTITLTTDAEVNACKRSFGVQNHGSPSHFQHNGTISILLLKCLFNLNAFGISL